MTGHRRLDRRTFLRGAGAAVGLPLFDAMIPAFASTGKPPCRMVFVYVPNGIIMNRWAPPAAGPLPEALPHVLEPVAAYRDQLLLLSGLTQDGGRAHGDGPGDHARAAGSYLTGVHPKKTFGADMRTGVSVDQIAAQTIGKQTRFASLELGCEEGLLGGNCDNGYSCAYSNTISWRTPSSPLPMEISPRSLFERLFGGGEIERDPARRAKQAAYDKSILDFVLDDASRLKTSLGPTDRRKLDEYLFSIRDIEKRIESAERNPAPTPSFAKPVAGAPANLSEHSRLMFDLLAIALQSDLTRVATLMLSVEQSNRSYPEIGIPESHHGLSHHLGNQEKIEKLVRINRFHMDQFAYFLKALSSARDGDGTLLDHSIVLYGSGLADGNRHEHHNLPSLLAGRGCGSVKPGRHVRYPDETPMTNLFVAMLDRVGTRVDSFANSKGRLELLSDL